jgi:hypothetical protein
MVAKKRAVYLCAANPKGCLWRDWYSPQLDAAASVEHDVLALLVKLIEALAESSLGFVSGVKLPKMSYERVMIKTVLQP